MDVACLNVRVFFYFEVWLVFHILYDAYIHLFSLTKFENVLQLLYHNLISC